MEKLVETLQQYFSQNPPAYGGAESVLDILYGYYIEHGSSDNEKIMNQFATLRALVDLPPQKYDPIFYVDEYGCSTAELDSETKNLISHRGNALRLVKEKLIDLGMLESRKVCGE